MPRNVLSLLIVLPPAWRLSAHAEFYQGKQVKVIGGFTIGGFYKPTLDQPAKVIARMKKVLRN